MSIFQENIYLRPILIKDLLLDKSFLFIGKIENELRKIIEKLDGKGSNIEKLSKSDTEKLLEVYGPIFIKELEKHLKKNVNIIYQTIYSNDNIRRIKDKIFCFMSDEDEEKYYVQENQYLFLKNRIDNTFFLEIIENIFKNYTSLSKKDIKHNLKKFLDKEVELKSKFYLKNDLKKIMYEFFRDKRNNTYYDIPLSINFKDKSNDLLICEYADILKNNDEENLHNDRVESNDYTILTNYEFDGVIYLYNIEDFKKHESYSDYLKERYWIEKSKSINKSSFQIQSKQLLEIFTKEDNKYNNFLLKPQLELYEQVKEKNKSDFEKISENQITNISFLSTPIISVDLNLIKLFELLKVDRNIPYINYIAEKRRQSKLKIYEPAYYGDDVDINELLLKQWGEEQLNVEERKYLTKKHYIIIKCKFNDLYITYYVNKDGVSIINFSSITMNKQVLFNINLQEIIETINNKVVSKINRTIGKGNVSKGKVNNHRLEPIKFKFVKILQLCGYKKIKLNTNIPIQVLQNLINHYNEFLFLKYKQTKDEPDIGFRKKKNNFGIKKINSFGSIKSIDSFISQLILESNNEINKTDIEKQIVNSFNISKTQAVEIYSNLLKTVSQPTSQDEAPNILAALRKNLRKTMNDLTFQINYVSDKVYINYANIRNVKDFIFFNKLMDYILKEYLIKKTYKITKEQKKIQEQEQKLDEIFTKQISSAPESVFEMKKQTKFFDNSSNDNSNNNSNNNNNNDNNDNNDVEVVEEELLDESDDDMEVKIELEYDNLKEYFTEMRARYDPELFISKRKTKDKMITDKREEPKIKYTTRCQSVNDKFPIIISKNKLKDFQKDPEILEGLDLFYYNEVDKKTKEIVKEKAAYYIYGGHKNKNVYICPRIWCVKCEIPISPIKFVKNTVCPRCKGGILKDKKERITNKKSVYVRQHSNTWKDAKKTSFLNRFLNDIINGKTADKDLEDLTIKELKNSQKSMYPYYLKPQKIDKNIPLTCCGSKAMPLEKEEEVEQVKVVKGETIYYFLNKTDVVDEYKIAIPSVELNKLLGNKKEERSRAQYKYYFKLLNQTYIFNGNFTQKKRFYRLGVDKSLKNPFINCMNSLIHLDKVNRGEVEHSKKKDNYIETVLTDSKIFKPSLFIQLINGNVVELFKHKYSIKEYLKKQNEFSENLIPQFKKWIKDNIEDLALIGIDINDDFNYGNLLENNAINELFNIFTSYHEFINYILNSKIKKNIEFVWDLFSKDNLFFEKGLNIIMVEVDNTFKKEKYNILCPKYYVANDFYSREKESIIILKVGKEYEVICNIEFKNHLKDIKNVEIKFPYSIIKQAGKDNLLNIMIYKCSKETIKSNFISIGKLQNSLKDMGPKFQIIKYVRGKYPKVLGVILKNHLYIPVLVESIKNEQLGDIVGINSLKNYYLLGLNDFLEMVGKLDKKISDYLKIKYIFNENDMTFIRLRNEHIIPVKPLNDNKINKILLSYYSEEEVAKLEQNKMRMETESINNIEGERRLDEFSIDDLIFDERIVSDERVEYMLNYKNNENEFKNIILAVNSYFIDEKNKDVSKKVLKIVINPIFPLKKKRKDIFNIFSENSIFDKLFEFTETKYFKKSKVVVQNCYDPDGETKCKLGKKINVSKYNLINGEDNEELFLKLIIEELINDVVKGTNILTKKIEEYEVKSLDSIEKRDQITFSANSLERIFHRLYSKRKTKHLRNIENLDVRKRSKSVDVSSIEEDDEPSMKSVSIKKIKKINKSISKNSKKIFKGRSLKPIVAGTKNMFNIDESSDKVKGGDCIFPFNMISKEKNQDGIIKSRPWHSYDECILSKEGPFCATKVKKSKKVVKGKLKHLNEYQETKKHESTKGYCNWEEYFKKQLEINGGKINPDCQMNYKVKKDSGNGKILVDIEGCIPDREENIDVEKPKLICPDKKELKKSKIFMKRHKQLNCFS